MHKTTLDSAQADSTREEIGQEDSHRQNTCKEGDFPHQTLVKCPAFNEQAVRQNQIQKSPKYIGEVLRKPASQCI